MQSRNRHQRAASFQRAFSLIELLVVVAILLILVAVTLQFFRQYASVQQFQRTADEVGYLLQLARQQTMASKDDTTYGVYVGTSTVELFSGTTPVPGAADNVVLAVDSGSTVATSSLSGGAWFVTFARVSGVPSATGTITVSDPVLGRTATYTLTQLGLVQ